MKKKIIIIAAALTGAAVLTGCGSADMPKKYSRELDYTFGGSYTCEKVDRDEQRAYADKLWHITYTDRNGREHTGELISQKYDKEMKEYFADRDHMEKSYYYDFAAMEAMRLAKIDMVENIISRHLDIEPDLSGEENLYETDEYSLIVLCYPILDADLGATDAEFEELCRVISPETGTKLCDYGLKEMAREEYSIIVCSMTLKDGADQELYIDKMEKIAEDYVKYTGEPMNYRFTVQNADKKKLYEKCCLLGEIVDQEKAINDYKEAHSASRATFSTLITDRLYGLR